MKTFGLVVPKGKGRIFEANVLRRLLDEEHALAAVVLPLLEAWCAIRNRAPSSTGSCSVRCATTQIADGS